MLYYPYRSFNKLLIIKGKVFLTYTQAYRYYVNMHLGAHPYNYYNSLPDPTDKEEFEEDLD